MSYPKELKNNTFLFSTLLKEENYFYNQDGIKVFEVRLRDFYSHMLLLSSYNLTSFYNNADSTLNLVEHISTKEDYDKFLKYVNDGLVEPTLFYSSSNFYYKNLFDIIKENEPSITSIENLTDDFEKESDLLSNLMENIKAVENNLTFKMNFYFSFYNNSSNYKNIDLCSSDSIFVFSNLKTLKDILSMSVTDAICLNLTDLSIRTSRVSYFYFKPDFQSLTNIADMTFSNSFYIDRVMLESKNKRTKGSFIPIYTEEKLNKIGAKYNVEKIPFKENRIIPRKNVRYNQLDLDFYKMGKLNNNSIYASCGITLRSNFLAYYNMTEEMTIDEINESLRVDNGLSYNEYINNIYFYYKFINVLDKLYYYDNPVVGTQFIPRNIDRKNVDNSSLSYNLFSLYKRITYLPSITGKSGLNNLTNLEKNNPNFLETYDYNKLEKNMKIGVGLQTYSCNSVEINQIATTLTISKLFKYYLIKFKEKYPEDFKKSFIGGNRIGLDINTTTLFKLEHPNENNRLVPLISTQEQIFKYYTELMNNQYAYTKDYENHRRFYSSLEGILSSIENEEFYSSDLLSNTIDNLRNDNDLMNQYIKDVYSDSELSNYIKIFKRHISEMNETNSKISKQSLIELDKIENKFFNSVLNYVIDENIPNIKFNFYMNEFNGKFIQFIFGGENGYIFFDTYSKIYTDLNKVLIDIMSDNNDNLPEVNEYLEKIYSKNNLSFFEESKYTVNNCLQTTGGLANRDAEKSISKIVDIHIPDSRSLNYQYILDNTINDNLKSYSFPNTILELELDEEE